jgi:hypothetical protein
LVTTTPAWSESRMDRKIVSASTMRIRDGLVVDVPVCPALLASTDVVTVVSQPATNSTSDEHTAAKWDDEGRRMRLSPFGRNEVARSAFRCRLA